MVEYGVEEHYIEITHTGENGECDECKSNQQPIGQDGLAAYLLTKRSPVGAGDDVEEDRG